MTQSPAHHGVHLVGSIPLDDNEAVFRTVAGVLGDHVARIPDGETGKRKRWNAWTAPTYERTPGLELVDPPEDGYTPWRQARLVVDPGELRLARLGYAEAAIDSYRVFARLKAEGTIPEHVRFQICLPTPIAPLIVLVEETSRAGVEPAIERRLHSEIDEILAAIPHDQLAIQWDVCQDVGIWEGFYPCYFDDPKAGVVARLVRCIEKVPDDVPVGLHICYGDFEQKHFMEPRDLGVATEIINAVTEASGRSVQWWHVPVPQPRDDDAYFAPLERLAAGGATVYLGLVHADDGQDGALRRIEVARRHLPDFGVATECGFGRRAVETVEPLMALHAEIAESAGAPAR